MQNVIIVAAKGVILREGRALLIKRSPYDGVWAGTWELSGGKLEFGEGLEECLLREIREETGLEVTIKRLLYANTFLTHPWRQAVVVTYLCESAAGEVKLSGEHTEALWATAEELRRLMPESILKELEANGVPELLG